MFTRLSRTVSRKCSSVLATNKTILLDIIERQIKRQKANGKRQKCSGAEFVFVTSSRQTRSLLRIASRAFHGRRGSEIRNRDRRQAQKIHEVPEFVAVDADGHGVRYAIDAAI